MNEDPEELIGFGDMNLKYYQRTGLEDRLKQNWPWYQSSVEKFDKSSVVTSIVQDIPSVTVEVSSMPADVSY